MTYVISEMPAIYFDYLQNYLVLTLFYSIFTIYMVFYTFLVLWYMSKRLIIEWKDRCWKAVPESRVLEEVKYIIRKHNDCADLDTMESAIHESINLTKYSEPYRMDCFQQGLKQRVRILESV